MWDTNNGGVICEDTNNGANNGVRKDRADGQRPRRRLYFSKKIVSFGYTLFIIKI
ncbi:hypothetical protein [Hugenholtzia roseola]|uniref:hypothetical protein n=1 Tax=Hugenholtzia roseola TaxID=1002 RepID=UPI000404C2D1|nr:hypothetical protein [Hugenholtzia roseola]